jgi:AcrR family transcriptional regulator
MDNPGHIRDAATRLFAERGFNGASLQTIADEVGLTKQTLLYHFPSKVALRRAVIDNMLQHWRKRLPRLLEAFATSGAGCFEALTGELIGFFRADPDRAKLVIREMLDYPDELRARLVDTLRPWILLVAEYIRRGQAAGLIYEDVDAELYVMHVIVLVTNAVAARLPLVGVLTADGDEAQAFDDRYFVEIARLARSGLFKHSLGDGG